MVNFNKHILNCWIEIVIFNLFVIIFPTTLSDFLGFSHFLFSPTPAPTITHTHEHTHTQLPMDRLVKNNILWFL